MSTNRGFIVTSHSSAVCISSPLGTKARLRQPGRRFSKARCANRVAEALANGSALRSRRKAKLPARPAPRSRTPHPVRSVAAALCLAAEWSYVPGVHARSPASHSLTHAAAVREAGGLARQTRAGPRRRKRRGYAKCGRRSGELRASLVSERGRRPGSWGRLLTHAWKRPCPLAASRATDRHPAGLVAGLCRPARLRGAASSPRHATLWAQRWFSFVLF